ncbi:MAG: Mur ligase domain-containing protein, partial [Candidatus Komeilibacteria bacterium]|nr:Mur ligase domain-containing protein [Candidatus Komeilibacteria bacterium]
MIQAKNVHIIGIGGIGTSAVAKWWKEQGATVTGSDVHQNELILELQKMGIDVRLGHFAENVPDVCDLIIHSRAVSATNVERQVASERNITDISYPQFLGQLAKNY